MLKSGGLPLQTRQELKQEAASMHERTCVLMCSFMWEYFSLAIIQRVSTMCVMYICVRVCVCLHTCKRKLAGSAANPGGSTFKIRRGGKETNVQRLCIQYVSGRRKKREKRRERDGKGKEGETKRVRRSSKRGRDKASGK